MVREAQLMALGARHQPGSLEREVTAPTIAAALGYLSLG